MVGISPSKYISPNLPRPWREGLGVDFASLHSPHTAIRPTGAGNCQDEYDRLDGLTLNKYDESQKPPNGRPPLIRSKGGDAVSRVLICDGTQRKAPETMLGADYYAASYHDRVLDDLADPNSVASRARLYTDASALHSIIGAGAGATIRGSKGWKDAPVRLVKAEYIVKLWKSNQGVLPPRQSLPEEAFYDGPPDRARLVALSVPWLGDEHPDWSEASALQRRANTHLATIGPLLQAFMQKNAPVFDGTNANQSTRNEPVAVYWDYLSVYHDARDAMLTGPQSKLHTTGLPAANYLFAHAEVEVWVQARLSQAEDAHNAAPEQIIRNDVQKVLGRGMCRLHLHLAALGVKPPHKVLDLGRLQRGVDLSRVTDFADQIAAPCSLAAPPRESGLGLTLPPIVTAERFANLCDKAKFRHDKERREAMVSYQTALSDISAVIETIWRPRCCWTDLEVSYLSEAMPLCRRLRVLNLAGNGPSKDQADKDVNGISDRGIMTLMQSLPASLAELDLSMNYSITEIGAAILALRLTNSLGYLNLYGIQCDEEGGTLKACARKLAPPEMNETGITKRLIKLSEPAGGSGEDVAKVVPPPQYGHEGDLATPGGPTAVALQMSDGSVVTQIDAASIHEEVLHAACAVQPLPTPFLAPLAVSATAYDHLFVVAMLGDPGSGKSCLLERFANEKWYDRGRTIGVDVRMRSLRLVNRDVTIRLQIWDAGGADSAQPALINSIYTGVHGVVVCYDSAERASFDSVKKWLKNVDKLAPAGVSKVLVGGKEDAEPSTHYAYVLEQSAAEGKLPAEAIKVAKEEGKTGLAALLPSSTKRVTPQEGQKLGKSLSVPFVSASALEGAGVDEAFALLAESMYEEKEAQLAKKRKDKNPKKSGSTPLVGHGAVIGALGQKEDEGGWFAKCFPKPQTQTPQRGGRAPPENWFVRCVAKCLPKPPTAQPQGAGTSNGLSNGKLCGCIPKAHEPASAAKARARNEQRRRSMSPQRPGASAAPSTNQQQAQRAPPQMRAMPAPANKGKAAAAKEVFAL